MTISVIIPTYNREKTIKRSIESVLSQTISVDEIIIVDDCGNDNTKSIIDSFNDKIIKYIKLPENGGPAVARNEGVKIATCDWIAFHDSDDEWLPNKIENQINYINSHPGVEFVYCSYKRSWADEVIPFIFNLDKYEGDMLETLLKHNTVGAPTILMKKQLFEDIGGFETSIRCMEDWDFAIKVSKENYLGFIEEPQLLVHRVDMSVSHDNYGYLQAMCYIIGTHKNEFIKYNKFNSVIINLINDAKKLGVEKEIEKLLALYISL
ncbi:MAG: glycosyltransferase family 2 protein [Lachnospiraceae bacterium]|nr:glycosyltransferase family 2 protein [Lachnospiraceae bacterium]